MEKYNKERLEIIRRDIMKKITTFILMMYLIGSFFIPIQIESVKAIQDGDLYISNYENFAIGTTNYTEYISGDVWYNAEMYAVNDNEWQVIDEDDGGSPLNTQAYGISTTSFSGGTGNLQYIWMNFTGGYKNISLDVHNKWIVDFEWWIYFYCSDTQMAYFDCEANDGAVSTNDRIYMKCYDQPNHENKDESEDMNFSVIIHDNDSMSITAVKDDGTLPHTRWENDLEGNLFITRIYIVFDPSVSLTYQTWIDNLTINIADYQEYPWQVDYSSYGSVTESYEGSLSFHVTSTLPYAGVEIEKADVGLAESGITIHQVALAVDNNTDYSYMIVNCQINGYNFGDFDASYTIEIDGTIRYILVWNLLNHIFYPNDLLVEFEAIRLINGYFKPLYTSEDVDDDGDTEYFYWGSIAEPTYFDGEYDGDGSIFKETDDLQYQVWYETTGEGGEYEEEEIEHDIYLNFYDYATGLPLRLYGSFKTPTGDNYFKAMLRSDLWAGEYDGNINGQSQVHITDEWIDGTLHWINLTGLYGATVFNGKINGESVSWFNSANTFQYYFVDGTEISIWLYSEGGIHDIYSNCRRERMQDEGCFQGSDKKYCTDKVYYDYGETILFRMYFPSLQWLNNHGTSTTDWKVTLWDESEFTWEPEYTWNQGTDFEADPYECKFLYLTFNATTSYGIEDEFKKYQLKITHDSWPLEDQMGLNLMIYCTGSSFSPTGDIISVSPDPAQPRENVQIAFTVNNQYQLKIEGVTNHYSKLWSGDFNYYTKFVNISLEESGVYNILLSVFNGYSFELVDDTTLNVTGEYYYGGDAEYLWCPQYRYVLGDAESPIKIYYRTLINDSLLRITSPRGENTSFSTYVDIDDTGIYTINTVGLFMAIGIWNVTLFANDTHYSSFNLICEEGNYIEFGKNQYIEDEDIDFTFIIKHDYFVGLTLYKDDVAVGTTCRLGIENYAYVLDPVVIDACGFQAPEVGEWRIEMWRLNQNNKMYELAESTCSVIRSTGYGETPQSQESIIVFISQIDPIIKGVIGLAICIGLLFLPFMIQQKKLYKGDINPIIYSVCLGSGAIFNFIFGLWAVEYAFFLCVMAGFGVFATYILQKRGGNG